MQFADELMTKREALERFLEKRVSAEQRRLELRTFDIIITARQEYGENVAAGINAIGAKAKEIAERAAQKATAEYLRSGTQTAIEEIVEKARREAYQKDDLFFFQSHVLSLIDEFGHKPAYIFVLNYDPANTAHQAHTFGGEQRGCDGKSIFDEGLETTLLRIAYDDDAILVGDGGTIHGTVVQLVNVNPLEIEGIEPDPEIQRRYGFLQHVHTRHFSALGGSDKMRGTVIYTLGEAGYSRRFENGRITWSTFRGEPAPLGPRRA